MDEACLLCLAGMSAGLTARSKTNLTIPRPKKIVYCVVLSG